MAAGGEAAEARGASQGAGVQATGAETGAPAGEGGGGDAEEDSAGGAAHPHCSSQARDHPAPVRALQQDQGELRAPGDLVDSFKIR